PPRPTPRRASPPRAPRPTRARRPRRSRRATTAARPRPRRRPRARPAAGPRRARAPRSCRPPEPRLREIAAVEDDRARRAVHEIPRLGGVDRLAAQLAPVQARPEAAQDRLAGARARIRLARRAARVPHERLALPARVEARGGGSLAVRCGEPRRGHDAARLGAELPRQ